MQQISKNGGGETGNSSDKGGGVSRCRLQLANAIKLEKFKGAAPKLAKYVFKHGAPKHAIQFNKAKEEITRYIQANCADTTDYIKASRHLTEMELDFSTRPGARVDKINRHEYCKKYYFALKKEMKYKGHKKAYVFILGQCSYGLRAQL